ncbi:hypothetical protein K431DRAFT_288697 [Polychaeton citri CBS 116435]|uniref:F-box domain-containing protein n=1 Tax=Polychaeton citri CBS 116435 TaxID=1314669 RepID=A0A9P4Q0I9_9PEZI|nr:hypothetical protein K431DRAFT_288697 [Polychaeton citri CBS 116435]
MSSPPGENEAALEAFRRQWKEEVSARNRVPNRRTPSRSADDGSRREPTKRSAQAAESGPSTQRHADAADEVEPRSYHDLPNKEELLKLGAEGQNHDRDAYKLREPVNALEHYERAVEKETQGQLGDSIKHYRTAFKLDDAVHEKYKQKHFAHAWSKKPGQINPSNASATVPNTAHHSLQGRAPPGLPASLKELVDSFAELHIEPAAPPTDASPQAPSPIAALPEEILSHVLTELAIKDVAAFARLALVCKRLAYLVLTEERIWKRIVLGHEHGFAAMHYDYQCEVEGDPLEANDEIARYLGSYDEIVETQQLPEMPNPAIVFATTTQSLLHSHYAASWRQMFRQRPRVRFNGCYISTVNYTRPGMLSTNTLSWGAPVHVVTYYRYLRFFRDGTAISLLTTSEPTDVVHHLTRENLHKHHGNTLPSSVMKDALRGRWRLTGPMHTPLRPAPGTAVAEQGEEQPETIEAEGDVHIETEGVVPKYMYKMQLGMSHAGKGARNNKLAWKGFWSYNRLADDWAEFGLKNDRAFYWSRVRSYGNGL